jgi:NAD+ dependent glucose-6-phosphate dehydrogenase
MANEFPVVVTGAAGLVGGLVVAGLRDRYALRPTDVRDGDGIAAGDLRDAAFVDGVLTGAGAVVHLAANADPDVGWADLRGPNADALVTLLDAAVRGGTVRTVVLASSLHAMGGHLDAGRTGIGPDLAPYPCCAYGATKVLGETLGRVYTDLHGLSVRCLRLGGVAERPLATSWLGGWLSSGDAVRLVEAALTADVRYGVYHGISANTGSMWSWASARDELGYRPRDDSAEHAHGVTNDLENAGDGARLAHLT